jgi:hypothetical protein
MSRGFLAVWLLRRRRERFTPQLMAVLAAVVDGDETARREFAEMDQDDESCRSWTNTWLARRD